MEVARAPPCDGPLQSANQLVGYEAIDRRNAGHDDRASPLQPGDSPWHLQAQMFGPDFSPHAADTHIVEGLSIGDAHPSEDIARNGEVA
jgi:hypothetical protein